MSELQEVDKNAFIRLKWNRYRLTRQQYQTLKGQILAGNADAAMKGLDNILGRRKTTIDL